MSRRETDPDQRQQAAEADAAAVTAFRASGNCRAAGPLGDAEAIPSFP